jgi:hypothetical protein
MPKLTLDRQTLAKFLPNHQAIVAFEKVLTSTDEMPDVIEEALMQAAQAVVAAGQALAMLADLVDDTLPRAQLGTLSAQNHDAVEITGGKIGLDAGTVGAPSFYLGGDTTTGLYRIAADNWGLSIAGVKLADYSATAAAYTQNVSTIKQLVSTVATGTAPLVVDSTTLVANLYVARAALADDATHATNADNAITANALTSPSSYPTDATDLPTVITLANALKAAAISKGL